MDLQDKVILLTGASSGIGYALAKLLPKENSSLALIARRKNLLDTLAESLIMEKGTKVKSYECDVGNREQVKAVFTEVKKDFGSIDIAILNAGAGGRASVDDFNPMILKELINVNLIGMANCIEQLLNEFIGRKNGVIVGVSSLADSRGFPKSGFYAASKAAASILLESLRVELKDSGVKVITVKPGFVKTPMTDKNEFYMPFLLDADKAAKIIIKGIKKEKKIIRFPLPIALGSKFLKIIPDWLFEFLLSKKLPARKEFQN